MGKDESGPSFQSRVDDDLPQWDFARQAAGKEFAFGSKALDLQRKDRMRPTM
jgi:hypothetical protein